ncbi:ABC transporter ATP-binding protein [Streptomyces halstedii]|uniref:ABC transporter ATP-binding protein n=1 Tax=Streptomyces TaxID=1883 RepID=UPI0004917AFD|nr:MULTISPECIES: ABC transporter ATP-binding protein [Streptomyces]MYR72238.1 ATP-binding cassette domain-containing protein [Streptomyces sp. SID4925]MYY16407.1 ATP-binding cassette domain-containing protein [Streptomyces sp. SID4912]SBU99246.1 iron complex transport system ATP-binding protein [Streptomyces sp. OspMP-M45]SCD76716.1 iron complex transport system ATP-binding protein [Streptomyces sp. PpalLS-921]SCD83357.1 iron complex transport system ATP-binding protein [Streptomyces sp. Dpond
MAVQHITTIDSAAGGVSRLAARGVTVGYGGRTVIDGLDVSIPPGLVTTIIGPNGCGKSTLLRTLTRLLKPAGGTVVLDGEDISRLRTRDVAKRLGLLPQAPVAPEGLTVADLVARGRHPHQSWLRQWSSDDASVVERALAMTGVLDLADRPVDSLSGGQRQRVWISMTLAQGTDLLLLDEPTTYLDLAHAIDVLDLVDDLHESGRTVVMVLHDLNLATRYSDHLVVMRAGAILAQGHPREVVTEELLYEAFGLRAKVIDDPVGDRPLIVPIGRAHVRLDRGPHA